MNTFLIILFLPFTISAANVPCIIEKSLVIRSCTDQRYRLVKHLNPRNEFIEDVRFNEAVFENSTFENIIFRRIDFNGAVFKKVIFKNCQFIDTNFSGSRWNSSRIINSTFKNVSFSRAYFDSTKIKSDEVQIISKKLFENCYSVGSYLQNSPLCNDGLF